jgi:uncharacterized protein YbgA (DUF1722 family)/uncharacterized protein YbbK (DUF523 family)
MAEPIRIGISACLLGEAVRWDGGHKRDAFLVEIFGPHVEWVAVCPEVELGLGTPRETMHLVAADGAPRLMTTKTGIDHSEAMRAWSARRLDDLSRRELSGYVLKKDSPSCGMERVRVHRPARGVPARDGRGLFAAALLDRFPLLPVEEEGRLSDPKLRESFIERVFAYRRLRSLFQGRWTLGALVRFHTAHKLQLLAHSPPAYRELGTLVAEGKRRERSELRALYERGFMRALGVAATRGRHANVLQHMLGYFKEAVDTGSRAELAALIDDYRAGLVPLIVPIALIRHHVRRLGVEYLDGQVYLEPHPNELMLRNHV